MTDLAKINLICEYLSVNINTDEEITPNVVGNLIIMAIQKMKEAGISWD